MAATYYHVTVAGAGAKTGASWATAMGYAEFETSFEALAASDVWYFIQAGTYTLTSDLNSPVGGSGTALLPNYVIGVKAATTNEGVNIVASDYGVGVDRPTFTDAANAYAIVVDNYWKFLNIIMTTSDTFCIRADQLFYIENCKLTNDGAATRSCLQMDNDGNNSAFIINNELISTNGQAIVATGFNRILHNYIHDSATGIKVGVYDCLYILGNVIDTCPIGIDADNASINNVILNNTIYNDSKEDAGSIGIDAGTGCYGWVVSHNIITGFATGINFGADTSSNIGYFDYNDIYDCTADRANVPTGSHDMDVDPAFDGAAGGDFSLAAGSGCINTGISILGT